jgi:hypothetical protein
VQKKFYEAFDNWERRQFESQWYNTFKPNDSNRILFAIASDIGKDRDGLVVYRTPAGALRYRYLDCWHDSYAALYAKACNAGTLQDLLDKKVAQKQGVLYWRQPLIQELIDEIRAAETEQVS